MENGARETLSELANRLAEIENAENGQDDRMYLAINRFIGTREQSYEQFLNGFTQLTGGDVLKYNENRDKDHSEGKSNPDLCTNSHNAQQTKKEHELEDELEVEMLEEVCRSSSSAGSGKPSGRSLVKFDNFVEDEPTDANVFTDDPDLNDLLLDSSYTASFNETATRETTPDCQVDHTSHELGSSEQDFETETNFGELDDNSEPSAKHSILPIENQTYLELKSIVSLTQNDSTPHEEQTVTDAVEEFHLDPSFDYDNVRLTPKFSEEECRLIMASADLAH